MSDVKDFTKGSVPKILWAFFLPLFLTNMLQQFYNFADTAIVKWGLGDNAVGAVGNMGSLVFLIMGFSMGLANGFSVSVAQAYGAKDYAKLRRIIASEIELGLIIAVILTTVSALFLHKALVLINTDEIIMHESLIYGHIIFGGLICSVCFNMGSFTLRALGDSKTPLKAIIVSSVLNIILDVLLIIVFRTGVGGAAGATVFSQLVSATICFNKLRKIDFIKLEKRDFYNSFSFYWELIKNGIPMALMNSITAIGCMTISFFVNDYGVDYTDAYAACSKYINLFMMPACTAGHSFAAFTGQNYGAGEYGRIREGLKVCLLISLISYIVLGSIMVFMPGTLAKVLLKGDKPIALTFQYFRIAGAMLFTVDFLFVLRSGVQAMGKPVIPMISGIAEMVLRVVFIALLFGKIGFYATAVAEASAWTGAFIMNGLAFVICYAGVMKRHKKAVT